MLEPWGMVNLSYKVTSHVAGYFSVEVSTSSTGKKVSMGGGLTVSALAGPSGYMTTNHHGDRALGDREFINGSMTNKYPYTLHDVKLMVLLGNNFRGLLSREDFMEFQPSEMAFSVLESNQTVNFSFNVTLNSAGKWKMTVVALWGGNASWGGDGVLQELQVFRTRFVYSPIGIVITIAVVSVAPKAVDLVIRRIRRIGS